MFLLLNPALGWLLLRLMLQGVVWPTDVCLSCLLSQQPPQIAVAAVLGPPAAVFAVAAVVLGTAAQSAATAAGFAGMPPAAASLSRAPAAAAAVRLCWIVAAVCRSVHDAWCWHCCCCPALRPCSHCRCCWQWQHGLHTSTGLCCCCRVQQQHHQQQLLGDPSWLHAGCHPLPPLSCSGGGGGGGETRCETSRALSCCCCCGGGQRGWLH